MQDGGGLFISKTNELLTYISNNVFLFYSVQSFSQDLDGVLLIVQCCLMTEYNVVVGDGSKVTNSKESGDKLSIGAVYP
ncbi:TPA: hypothetical protein ACPI87_000570 [Haemophilus influenzae]|uniref:Uncharacterized protein n=1 Tax=Haemophilus influenzae TaxID=727 RepID=A0A2S9RPX8_HAEIF|nr:hypothetical protein [Haemophilus influenzae]PRI46785.1 hypothetical protein BVZ70_00742 [Haemophilus influenzae]PRI87986.1 hypothetical protein BV020_00389 [Haemophilus influenzae]PRI89491.1 hypothetical protein BV021_01049 [Haemophilus influenzae]PRJ07376.1 hypothetical protein BV025_00807 [Haemophilus influenzae]PRJ61052.1 hypothetical protein BV102_00324 [Haemophilus influenzae]